MENLMQSTDHNLIGALKDAFYDVTMKQIERLGHQRPDFRTGAGLGRHDGINWCSGGKPLHPYPGRRSRNAEYGGRPVDPYPESPPFGSGFPEFRTGRIVQYRRKRTVEPGFRALGYLLLSRRF